MCYSAGTDTLASGAIDEEDSPMFTGIIEETGAITGSAEHGGGRALRITANLAASLKPGQSISINGACQTVVQRQDDTFSVIAVAETLRKTTLGSLRDGMLVNLERALQPTGRMDGHLVQGHVDATGTIRKAQDDGASKLFHIAFDPQYARYVIPVGSITIDGISLTVAHLETSSLAVAIIPHTYAHTNCKTWQPGTHVNLEFDMVGKYVVRYLEHHAPTRQGPATLPQP